MRNVSTFRLGLRSMLQVLFTIFLAFIILIHILLPRPRHNKLIYVEKCLTNTCDTSAIILKSCTSAEKQSNAYTRRRLFHSVPN